MDLEKRLEQYRDMGRKAARAMNGGDMGRWDFEQDYKRRSLAAEHAMDRHHCRAAFDEGYREVRHVPKFEPFR